MARCLSLTDMISSSCWPLTRESTEPELFEWFRSSLISCFAYRSRSRLSTKVPVVPCREIRGSLNLWCAGFLEVVSDKSISLPARHRTESAQRRDRRHDLTLANP